MRNKDKITGSIAAGAAGDALGYAVEFMCEYDIKKDYGERGITEYSLRDGEAQFSDDTQMTLFTAEGLLLTDDDAKPEDYVTNIRESYKCWYVTQVSQYSPEYEKTGNPLMKIKKLFASRAPGNTCMSAIRELSAGHTSCPANNSKGCGGVMRVAPIGLYFASTDTPIETSDKIAAEAAALTHGHPLGYLPAAMLAHIVRLGVEGSCSLEAAAKDAMQTIKKLYPETHSISEPGINQTDKLIQLIHLSTELSTSDMSDEDAISELGEGWVGDEALAIALFCAMRYYDDFDAALIASVNHDGDSDSTGAVTGNILGAFRGYEAMPQKYKDNLELLPLILKTAEELWQKKN